MSRVLQVLEEDLRTLRPGRASAELVTSLPVDVYGQKMSIQQLASISNDEQGNLILQPWDKSTIGAVEQAVRVSQLGFSVVNIGDSLKLTVPPLSQERRLEMVKLVGQKGEAARIQLRQIRGDAHQAATKEKTNGTMREDELSRYTKELNDKIDENNKQIKELVERKEKELMTV